MKKKIFIVLVAIVAIFFALYSCGKKKIYNKLIDTVKEGYFNNELSDVTIGKIMETLCTNTKWEYTSTDDGLILVTFTGDIDNQPIVMKFIIQNIYDQLVFQLSYFSLNGEEASTQNDISGVDELSTVPFILYKLYCQKINM